MGLTKISTDGVKDDAVTTDKLANAINTERTGKIANVVEDTSPQLGGALDTNGSNINFGDSTTNGTTVNRLTFGTATNGDLALWHDGNNSYIVDQGTGELRIRGAEVVKIQDTDSAENMGVFNKNGSVELYHNNNARAETIADGFKVKHSDDSGAATLKLENNSTHNSQNPKVKIAVDLASGKNGGSIEFIRGNNYQSSAAADSEIVISPTKNDSNIEIVRITQDYVRLHSNASGIQFNGDTAAANALDDYEEGTWTPAATSGFSSISYHNQNGYYTKIGNVVYFTIYIYVYQATGDSNNIKISLPFTSASDTRRESGGYSTYDNALFSSSHNDKSTCTWLIGNNQDYIRPVSRTSGGAINGNNTDLGSGGNNRYFHIAGMMYV